LVKFQPAEFFEILKKFRPEIRGLPAECRSVKMRIKAFLRKKSVPLSGTKWVKVPRIV
jgi:hypothetical protein